MITSQEFRYNFPEFASTSAYPAPVIDFWIEFAYSLLNADRWGSQLDKGAQLFVAHYVSLAAKSIKESKGAGIPGANTGPVSNKRVDKAEVSFDSSLSSIKGAGHWNLTRYGIIFKSLLNMFGAGPMQIGNGCAPLFNSGAAWPGPNTMPGFTSFG